MLLLKSHVSRHQSKLHLYLSHSGCIVPSAGQYLRIVLAACRLCWALLLARIPLHHAWMAIAARHMTYAITNKYMPNTCTEIVTVAAANYKLTFTGENAK